MKEIKAFLAEIGMLNDVVRLSINIIIISFCALGCVYIAGRYLNKLKSDRSKNNFGLICMFITTIIVVFYINFKHSISLINKNFDTLLDFGILIVLNYLLSVIFYCIVCWKFYDRMSNFIDKIVPSKKK